MQIRSSKLCESGKPPLVDEHAFPPTGFAVAWFGSSLYIDLCHMSFRFKIVRKFAINISEKSKCAIVVYRGLNYFLSFRMKHRL